ncbi:MAG: hypothetical protein WBE89_06175 [Methyloceanibacter sp.]
MAEQLGDVEILQQLLLVRRIYHLLRDIGDASRDARGELRDLLGDGRSNPDEHCHEESDDRDHHDGERGEMRKPGHEGERAMLAKARKIAVLAYQSAAATASTMTTPSAARMTGVGDRPRHPLHLIDDGGLERRRAFDHRVTPRDLRGKCADMRG